MSEAESVLQCLQKLLARGILGGTEGRILAFDGEKHHADRCTKRELPRYPNERRRIEYVNAKIEDIARQEKLCEGCHQDLSFQGRGLSTWASVEKFLEQLESMRIEENLTFEEAKNHWDALRRAEGARDVPQAAALIKEREEKLKTALMGMREELDLWASENRLPEVLGQLKKETRFFQQGGAAAHFEQAFETLESYFRDSHVRTLAWVSSTRRPSCSNPYDRFLAEGYHVTKHIISVPRYMEQNLLLGLETVRVEKEINPAVLETAEVLCSTALRTDEYASFPEAFKAASEI